MRRGFVAMLVLLAMPATGLAQTMDGSCAGGAGAGDAFASVVDALFGIFSAPAGPATESELVRHWAPTFYQDTDDSFVEGDYITRMDFDGDWQSDNNWDNLSPSADLRAYNYYSVVETETHRYILYADFHARDWEERCQPLPFMDDGCHENDLEGAMVVIRKDGSRYGKFELLATQAHGTLHLYRNDPRITPKKEGVVVEPGNVTFDGSHPELFVEAKGHGVYALGSRESRDFPGGDGVVYRPGTKAERPSDGNDRDVEYELLSIEDTFWQRRSDACDDGCTFDRPFKYGNATLGAAFDGGDHGDDSANPPWQWRSHGSRSGDFFFKPAETISSWVNLPGPVSTKYVKNPYLDAVRAPAATPGG